MNSGDLTFRPDPHSRPAFRTAGELIEHIVAAHHEHLRAELPRLERALAERAGQRELALLRRVRSEIEQHLLREEQTLFPLIVRLERMRGGGQRPERHPFGSLRNPIAFMLQDHRIDEQLLSELRPLIEPACAERLSAIEADLRVHVALEDEILFPWAVRLEEG